MHNNSDYINKKIKLCPKTINFQTDNILCIFICLHLWNTEQNNISKLYFLP